jgi:hypothetical protein
MVDSDPLFYFFAGGLLLIAIIYHLVRLKLRLPVLQLKPVEILKSVILPGIIFFVIFAGTATYFDIRFHIQPAFSKIGFVLISAGILLILYNLYEVIPGLISLNAMRKSESENNDGS